MKKKLFENKWVTVSCMFAVAISDLIGLTWAGVEFGAGFILASTYLVISNWK